MHNYIFKILTIITAIAAIGTMGAYEHDTISLTQFLLQLLASVGLTVLFGRLSLKRRNTMNQTTNKKDYETLDVTLKLLETENKTLKQMLADKHDEIKNLRESLHVSIQEANRCRLETKGRSK